MKMSLDQLPCVTLYALDEQNDHFHSIWKRSPFSNHKLQGSSRGNAQVLKRCLLITFLKEMNEKQQWILLQMSPTGLGKVRIIHCVLKEQVCGCNLYVDVWPLRWVGSLFNISLCGTSQGQVCAWVTGDRKGRLNLPHPCKSISWPLSPLWPLTWACTPPATQMTTCDGHVAFKMKKKWI